MPILHRTTTTLGLIPRYVSRFSCIGPDCEDTCCVGWQVYIDKKTFKAYKQNNDPVLGERLAHAVARTDTGGKAPDPRDYGRIVLERAGRRSRRLSMHGWPPASGQTARALSAATS